MELIPLKRIAQLRYGDALSAELRSPGEVPVYGSGGVSGSHHVGNTDAPAIVVGRKGSYGTVHWAQRGAFVIDTAYAIDGRTSTVDLRWLYYVLQMVNLKGSSQDVGVPGLSRETAHGVLVPTPPSVEEQRRIAHFLDIECSRVNRAVEARQRAIHLNGERFSSLIEWQLVGPAATSTRLKFLLARPLEYGAAEAAQHQERNWPRYIRTTDVAPDGNLRDETFVSLPPEIARRYMLADGDLLFTRSGATVGKTFLYKADWGPAAFAGYLIRARFRKDLVLPEYVAFFCQSATYWQQIQLESVSATIQNFNAERYGNLRVPYVPVEQQSRLVANLSAAEKITRSIQTLARQQVSLLNERRKALITAAVTGQIDVTTARGVDV